MICEGCHKSYAVGVHVSYHLGCMEGALKQNSYLLSILDIDSTKIVKPRCSVVKG
jgi:hypothetical protein